VLAQLVIASTLIVATTVVHAVATGVTLRALRWSRRSGWSVGSQWRKTVYIAGIVMLMFLASLVEIASWAVVYLPIQALPDLETALYFSAVTFTSLGYGDVTLKPPWRLLSALESANGVILFGWSTAVVFAFVREVVVEDERAEAQQRNR
jgi:hypothetical protein